MKVKSFQQYSNAYHYLLYKFPDKAPELAAVPVVEIPAEDWLPSGLAGYGYLVPVDAIENTIKNMSMYDRQELENYAKFMPEIKRDLFLFEIYERLKKAPFFVIREGGDATLIHEGAHLIWENLSEEERQNISVPELPSAGSNDPYLLEELQNPAERFSFVTEMEYYKSQGRSFNDYFQEAHTEEYGVLSDPNADLNQRRASIYNYEYYKRLWDQIRTASLDCMLYLRKTAFHIPFNEIDKHLLAALTYEAGGKWEVKSKAWLFPKPQRQVGYSRLHGHGVYMRGDKVTVHVRMMTDLPYGMPPDSIDSVDSADNNLDFQITMLIEPPEDYVFPEEQGDATDLDLLAKRFTAHTIPGGKTPQEVARTVDRFVARYYEKGGDWWEDDNDWGNDGDDPGPELDPTPGEGIREPVLVPASSKVFEKLSWEKGDCFRQAAKLAIEDMDGDSELVHGTVFAPLENKRILHAWVEKGDMVIDPVVGIETDKSRYYEMTQADPQHRYSGEQAAIMMMRNHHWGPWHEIQNETSQDMGLH